MCRDTERVLLSLATAASPTICIVGGMARNKVFQRTFELLCDIQGKDIV